MTTRNDAGKLTLPPTSPAFATHVNVLIGGQCFTRVVTVKHD